MYLQSFLQKTDFRSLRSRIHGPHQAVTLQIAQIYVYLFHLLSRALVRFAKNQNYYGSYTETMIMCKCVATNLVFH